MRTGFVLSARRKAAAIVAGVALCMLAVPTATALAQGSTGKSAPVANNNNPAVDTCGYPDTSNPPRSQAAFSESGVMAATIVVGSGSSAKIVGFATDEKGLLFGVTGSDPLGRPENPELWVTDLTATPGSRAGDWQQGGTGVAPDAVYGDTTSVIGTQPSTQHKAWSGLPYTPPAGLTALNFNAEAVWNASSLGLVSGHTYRVQDMTHDGDQNKTGGDVGEDCNLIGVPGPATFSLAKSVLPTGPVAVGTPLAYTVTITNTSGVAGDPGVVKDTPSGTTGLTYHLQGTPVPSAGTVTEVSTNPLELDWSPGNIAGGGHQTLTLTLVPTAAGGAPTPALTNTAYNTNTNCPTPMTTPGTCTTVTPLTQFGLAKTVSPTGIQHVGATLTYTVTVTNLTTTAGDPGTVSDNLEPNGVTYTVLSGPTGPGTFTSVNPGTFNWMPGNLAGNAHADATIVIQITGIVAGAASPSIANTAFDTVTNCPTPNLPDCTPNTPVPNFILKKTVDPTGPVTVGATLTYTVTETNTTANAGDGGTVSDTITANGVTYTITGGPTASQGTVSGTASPFSWTVGNIPGNGHATLTLVIKVTGVTPGAVNPTIVNTAVNTETNCATANNPDCTTNTPLIVLTLNKTVNKTSANLGDILTYTITIGNTGAAPATNVLVDDVFGGDAGYLVNDGSGGTVDSFLGAPVVNVTKLATGHYQWTYATIKPGDVDTVTFTAIIKAPTGLDIINNAGTVTLTNTVSIPSYNTGITTYNNPGDNPPPVTVSTVAPFSPGGVQALTTPPTGAINTVAVTAAGFLLLGGLGLILLGVLAQTPTTARRRQI